MQKCTCTTNEQIKDCTKNCTGLPTDSIDAPLLFDDEQCPNCGWEYDVISQQILVCSRCTFDNSPSGEINKDFVKPKPATKNNTSKK